VESRIRRELVGSSLPGAQESDRPERTRRGIWVGRWRHGASGRFLAEGLGDEDRPESFSVCASQSVRLTTAVAATSICELEGGPGIPQPSSGLCSGLAASFWAHRHRRQRIVAITAAARLAAGNNPSNADILQRRTPDVVGGGNRHGTYFRVTCDTTQLTGFTKPWGDV
jgi:hypothetical protein